MQRMLWAEAEAEGGGSSGGVVKKINKGVVALGLSSDEELEDDAVSEGEQKGHIGPSSGLKRKIMKKMKTSSSGGGNNIVREIMEDFMRQQGQMEAQWREAYEARESERRAKEMEWRQAMKALESERVMMERSWREREEQRRMREEARAEKRDALITALLNKLRREDNF